MDKLSTCVFQVSPLYQTLSLLHLWLIWLIWLYGLQLLWLSWHASFEIIFSYILYGMDALELDVFNVDVLDVDAAVECWTSKPKGYQTENKRYHSILWSLLLLFALCLALDWILFFCFFGLFDAQARADEIEALKKAKLTLASDWTHSSRFLNEPKLQTFEQLGRPQITWSLLTLVERPLWGVPTTWVRAALRVPRKVCDRCGSLLWHRLLMSLPGCFSCFGPLV